MRQHETLSAILAEMRKAAKDSYAEKTAKRLEDHEATGTRDALDIKDAIQCLRDDDKYLLDIADRIEAAAARERDEDRQLAAIAESDEAFARCARCDRPERAPGNAAAMRESIETMRRYAMLPQEELSLSLLQRTIHEKCDAALSAPARNCDRCEFWEDLWGLEFVKLWPDVTDDLQRAWLFVRWLFAPAQGKEADNG